MTNLFTEYVNAIKNLSDAEMLEPQRVAALNLHRDENEIRREVKMVYAPFDHVNLGARIVIVGLTPGRQQATNALRAAKQAIIAGESLDQAAKSAKVFASFSGVMRVNLVKLMDSVGLATTLGIQSTESLWTEHSQLVHFASALRYPVFIDGENWSGSQPDALRSSVMRIWLEQYTGQELNALPRAILVPLGPKVSAMLDHLANIGLIKASQILTGLPHPAGSNAERIKYFLGNKPAHLLSSKTNATVLDTARDSIVARVRAMS